MTPRPSICHTASMEYEIRIKGHLSKRRASWFAGMGVETAVSGETILRGNIPDQAALHGLLAKIRDLGIPLIAVNPICEEKRKTINL